MMTTCPQCGEGFEKTDDFVLVTDSQGAVFCPRCKQKRLDELASQRSRIAVIGNFVMSVGCCAVCETKGIWVATDDYYTTCSVCLRRVVDALDRQAAERQP